MEDANFFVSAPSAASGGSCKSPSSVNSATGAPNTAAVVGGQASFEPHTEFAFPPIGMGADVSTFHECFVYQLLANLSCPNLYNFANSLYIYTW